MTTKIPTDQDVQAALVPYQMKDAPGPVVISDDQEYRDASLALKNVITRKKEVDALRKTITNPLDEAKKQVQAFFNPVLNEYSQAEAFLRQGLLAYTQQQEKARRLEEARLRDEHTRAVAEAEAESDRARNRGDLYEARATVLSPAPPLPTYVSATPKVAGITTRSVWKAEVTDLMQFLIYVVENDAYHLIQTNQSALDALARSSKGLATVPGVDFHEEQSLVARS